MTPRTPGAIRAAWVLGALALGGWPSTAAVAQGAPTIEAEKVSRFGEYRGYSAAEFDAYERTSRYLTMRDGTKLAVDILRPTEDGKTADRPLPCVWSHTRYRRASEDGGGQVQCAGNSPLTRPLLQHGYNVVVVDVRGSGASYGTWKGIFTPEETQDAYEITEWIAEQPWCDGKVGMTGGSYLGVTQLMAASKKPPHLKALFPMVALFDLYDTAYHGGVYFDDFIGTWSELTRRLDTEVVAVGVDEDRDGAMLAEAIDQHRANRPLDEVLRTLPYRDGRDEVTGGEVYRDWHPAGWVDEINESKIPIYLWCGWFDSFTKDGFTMYRAFTAPRKLVMGAWSHSPRDPAMARAAFVPCITEQLRWFDYWLKGIDNGIMSEPPITYHSMRGPQDNEWRTASTWPPAETTRTKYHFLAGPSESVSSCNDGLLGPVAPSEATGQDDYAVDYTTTSGTSTRWDNAVGGGFGYPDMTSNDEKALTYTTAVLPADLDVTGRPIAHLWVSSTASDGDFFVFLEEVDAEGHAHYVSEGTLRASHRKLHRPPLDALGTPWHRSHAEDVVPLVPGQPVELVFDLQPTSNVFDSGHRLRLTIACADRDNASTPELSPAPTVSVYRQAGRASYVSLPVMTEGRR